MQIPVDWTFKSAEVAAGFDAHVREQLPWYDMATGAVVHIARHFITRGGLVYDIGASTGNIGIALEGTLLARTAQYVGIEESPEMVAQYRGPGKIVMGDACRFDYQTFDLAVIFLVLMFVPLHERKPLIHRLLAKMQDGGAIIVVDKVHPPSGWLGSIFRRLTLAGKVAAGADHRHIIEKELSLSGLQRPLDDYVLPECYTHEFFRFGEFVGWIITKSENSKYGY